MTFFDRLEISYLNVLRVGILVLATLFLIGAVIATANVVQKLVPDVAKADARKLVDADTLQDYRGLQTGAPAVGASDSSEVSSGPAKIDNRIKQAAASLVEYLRVVKGASVGPAPIERLLSEKQLSLPDNLQGDYADSLVKLTANLVKSRDPSVDVDALLQWHFAKFEAAKDGAAAQEVARAAKNAAHLQEAMIAAGTALSAFFLFLIVIFGFVLVKIERNLRLVQVVRLEPTAPLV